MIGSARICTFQHGWREVKILSTPEIGKILQLSSKMQILWQIIAFCLTTSVQGEPKEVNYCGRLDVRPDHVKHYLTTPGYPARAAEAGRCQWL